MHCPLLEERVVVGRQPSSEPRVIEIAAYTEETIELDGQYHDSEQYRASTQQLFVLRLLIAPMRRYMISKGSSGVEGRWRKRGATYCDITGDLARMHGPGRRSRDDVT